jgi:hypothetical protein
MAMLTAGNRATAATGVMGARTGALNGATRRMPDWEPLMVPRVLMDPDR